ncbi:hypothetical protein Nmel_002975 [Mimus melanotis]
MPEDRVCNHAKNDGGCRPKAKICENYTGPKGNFFNLLRRWQLPWRNRLRMIP